ncbi:MAG: 50S ribosomal protein L11 methyltransferase [Muribaculaceae bacterium]|nr:50S ribosomal protein L11 methyltransferase [Muribaculaceae bacterium]
MNDYINVRIDLSPCTSDTTDLLAAYLADIGYESFLPDETGLTAYIPSGQFSQAEVESVLADFPIPVKANVSHSLEEGRDWNEEWEKNYFRPILIEGKCAIHSSFHKDLPPADYDIVIDPKMAFGTGHHATTSMMVGNILSRDLSGKTVIDMGTGTGILAILAMMHGADGAYGIEIDPAACVNARENVDLNNSRPQYEGKVKVEILEGDASRLAGLPGADVFLANINRNVILADMGRYVAAMNPGAELILSGFYSQDIPMLERAAALHGLSMTSSRTADDGEWASVVFQLK